MKDRVSYWDVKGDNKVRVKKEISLVKWSNGSIEVFVNGKSSGVVSLFDNQAKRWKEEKKFTEALNDYFTASKKIKEKEND